MDNPILLRIFAVVASLAAIIFLWDAVFPLAKKQLKPRDVNTAKFFLFLLSLTFLFVAVHYGGDIIRSIYISDDLV
jgi:Na+-driven multidrug efflux pump